MKGFKVNGLLVAGLLLLSGCSTLHHYDSSPAPVVGTAWGEDVSSAVKEVYAERETRDPTEVIVINYSAKYPTGNDRVYSIRNGDLEYAIRDANFNSLPLFSRYNRGGAEQQYSVQARVGMKYQLYVRNYSRDTNYEIVATVDGLDVLNGQPGSLNNSGYIVNAGTSLSVQGFRKDRNTEAAFTFAEVKASYAANSAQGDIRNVGVIGFAAFELKGKAKTSLPPCSAQAFPGDNNGYAPPPCRK